MIKIIEVGTGYSSIPAKVGAATEIVIEELTRCFIKQKQDVQIIDLEEKDRKSLNFRFLEVKIPSFFKKTMYNLGIFHKLKRIIYSINAALLIRKLKIEKDDRYIVHFHNQYNYFFFELLSNRKARRNIITIYTVHSGAWSNEWNQIKNVIRKKYFMESFSLRKADHIIALNESMKRNMVTHLSIPNDKISLLPNGVNTELHKPISDKRSLSTLRKRHGLKNQKIVFHAGSICPNKNQLGIIKALLPLMKEKDVQFLFCGGIIDKEYFDEINRFTKENQIEHNVIYLGEVKPGKDLNEYYNLADALVFYSGYEACSLVVMEALSAGLPVFLSENIKFPGHELFTNKGLIYFNKENVTAKIRSLLFKENIMKALSKKARQAACRYISWENIANEHLKLFNKSISEENAKWKRQ